MPATCPGAVLELGVIYLPCHIAHTQLCETLGFSQLSVFLWHGEIIPFFVLHGDSMKALEVESAVEALPLQALLFQLLSPLQGGRVAGDKGKSWVGHLYWAGDMQDKAIAHYHSDGVPGISAITVILSSWHELYRKATARHYLLKPSLISVDTATDRCFASCHVACLSEPSVTVRPAVDDRLLNLAS